MSIQTISFRSPRPKDGTGNSVPEGSEVPQMKGRKALNLKAEIKRLDEVLEYLADTPCSFWACEGAKRPRNMVTCGKCWAMWEVASVRATLARQIGEEGEVDSFAGQARKLPPCYPLDAPA